MRRSTYLALAAAGLALFLGLWELLPRLGLVNRTLLPPPSDIPAAFAAELRAGYWQVAVVDSFRHYLYGLTLGTGLGVALGVAAALAPRFEAATAWVVRLLRPIPGLAWVPFAIIWFGISEQAATFIIVVGVLWINFFASYAAVRAVDRDLLEVADAFGHRRWLPKLVKIVLPAAAAGILGGVRTGLGQGWMSVVAAELFGIPGLGSRMMQASSLLATETVVVYMITIAVLYGLTDSLFGLLRDRVLAWQR
ncbi:MAG TPA: ABC transporter permease subunit [Alphaproteobacteria bacterium]|nr:ABC transporter permease subunit [Alphaproteobacteria bacterium]